MHIMQNWLLLVCEFRQIFVLQWIREITQLYIRPPAKKLFFKKRYAVNTLFIQVVYFTARSFISFRTITKLRYEV